MPHPKSIMLAALAKVRENHGGEIPSGRTDVTIESDIGLLYVRVYGKSPIRTCVTVQYVAGKPRIGTQ